MDRINEQAQSLFDRLFPKGSFRFPEHRDAIEKALRSVAIERDAEVEVLRKALETQKDDNINIAEQVNRMRGKYNVWRLRAELAEKQLRRRG